MAGQLERGASDRATDIEGTGIAADRRRVDQFAHATRGKSEGGARTMFPRQDLVRLAVVEEQVLEDLPVTLVNVVGHARALRPLGEQALHVGRRVEVLEEDFDFIVAEKPDLG